MSGFAITIEYLTGYAVATDPGNREQPEWPPHPARVFMAMAAAHFETDGGPAERRALRWLESLKSPEMSVPLATAREVATVYVPVNDATGIDVLPAKRSRQPRTFPRVFVGDQTLEFIWREADGADGHLDSLEGLCRKVTRIGHSSSLVWVRLERSSEKLPATHVPDEVGSDYRVRTVAGGALARLEESFNGAAVEEYSELDRRVKAAPKNDQRQLKVALVQRFPNGTPVSRPPVISTSTSYTAVQSIKRGDRESCFDNELIVLRQSDDDEQEFGIESTCLLMNALRDTIMKRSGVQPAPDWVSGHNGPNGSKLENGDGHMAVITLPFVNHPYADGHLLGAAIVCPRVVPMRERAEVFSKLFFTERGEPAPIVLKLGAAGTCVLERETRLSLPVALQTRTWCEGSRYWASVTPIVLDRFPKKDRLNDRAAWNEEVAEIISTSCANIGLPEPLAVRVEKTPIFRGSLRAMPGQGGFPLMPAKQGGPRFQVHVAIEFAEWVRGPVLLGAGRFRGYGLCRPCRAEVLK